MLIVKVMCRKLAVYDRWSGLVVHIAMDNCIIIDDICKFCTNIINHTLTFAVSFFNFYIECSCVCVERPEMAL